MIQNLIFGILLLTILFLTQQLFYIHPHVLADIIKVYSEISKQTKIIDKDHLFCNTDSLKMPHSFWEPQVTWHWKQYASETCQKPLSFYKFFSKHVSVWCQKNICAAPFLDTQELHSWSTLKANACIFLYI